MQRWFSDFGKCGDKLRERLAVLAYSLGWSLVKALPEQMAYRLFDAIADFAYRRGGRSIERLRSNLRRVVGSISENELDALTHRAMRSYLRYWCDAFRLPVWSAERVASTVEVVGLHHLDEAMARGGVVVPLPHSGNWDHAGAWVMNRGYHLVTVAESLKPQEVFEKFLAYRTSLGMEVYALGQEPDLMSKLADACTRGDLVALVADRDLSANGIEVKFFNGIAKMPAGPAVLSLQTGAALIPAHVSYNKTGITVRFHPPLSTQATERDEQVRDLTQQMADVFAQGIGSHPEDWHMLQRIWIDQ